MEITMIIGIIVYFLNFFTGKAKNQKIANQVRHQPPNKSNSANVSKPSSSGSLVTDLSWNPSSALLETMATRWVGHLGQFGGIFKDTCLQDMTDIQEPLTKESENLFSFWCSGRLVSHHCFHLI